MKSAGFKEWALVCAALGRGDQSIILRKGGIAEGRDGFSFAHDEFFLFPTLFHEQIDKVRTPARELPPAPDTVTLKYFARVEAVRKIETWAHAQALAPLHVLTDDLVRERFHYKGAGLQVAFVRIFEVMPGVTLTDEKRFGGCRSWVDLPALREFQLRAILSEADHQMRRVEFDRAFHRPESEQSRQN